MGVFEEKFCQMRSILFVDDEVMIHASLKRRLRPRIGEWDMAFFSSPLDALDAVVSGERPEVAVLDLRMPEMNGMDLAARLREESPDTVIIILTGYADLETAMKGINEIGIFRFYSKPCEADVLQAGIEDALREYDRRLPKDRQEDSTVSHMRGDPGIVSVALDSLAYGVIVLDPAGRVEFMNATAAGMLSKKDGLWIAPDGTCRGINANDTHRFKEAVRGALENDEATLVAIERKHSVRPLSVTLGRMDNGRDGMAGNVLVIITDPELSVEPDIDSLCHLFGFTRSEARLVRALVSGISLEDAADESGITVSTARSYLKLIFSKAGVNRQAELVQLVLASYPALRKPA